MQAANVLQTGLEQQPHIWLPPVCRHLTGKGAPESNPYHGLMGKKKGGGGVLGRGKKGKGEKQ